MSIPKIFEMLERSKIDPYDPGDLHDFPTVFRQTGHRRSGPSALVQDIGVLEKVTLLNFDASVSEFKDYCHSRGIYCKDVNYFKDIKAVDTHVQVHVAKIQDCWELWLREIGALGTEEYSNVPFKDMDILDRLIKTIYTMPQ